jgi:hypothetical protein
MREVQNVASKSPVVNSSQRDADDTVQRDPRLKKSKSSKRRRGNLGKEEKGGPH